MQESEPKTGRDWKVFTQSPLALFAGIFSLMETVILAFLSRGNSSLDPIDALVVILLTVTLFVLIVVARPQALYPPSEWKEPPKAPDARIALIAIILFIFIIGGGWAMKFAGPGWAAIIVATQTGEQK